MPDDGSTVVLGIDYGARRIGLATGNTLTGTARALTTIGNTGDPLSPLAAVIGQWQPGCVVIGLPLAPDGSDSASTRRVRRFAGQLREKFPGLHVTLHDERYTSQAAAARFAEARRAGTARRRDARGLDGVAAALILESWLADHEREPHA